MDSNSSAPRRFSTSGEPPKKTTGHDSVIKAIKDQNRELTIEKMSSGEKITGLIVGRDKYTITLKVDGIRRVIFKHDISEFYSREDK